MRDRWQNVAQTMRHLDRLRATKMVRIDTTWHAI